MYIFLYGLCILRFRFNDFEYRPRLVLEVRVSSGEWRIHIYLFLIVSRYSFSLVERKGDNLIDAAIYRSGYSTSWYHLDSDYDIFIIGM